MHCQVGNQILVFVCNTLKKQVFESHVHNMMHQIKLLQYSFCRMEVFSSNKDASVAGCIT